MHVNSWKSPGPQPQRALRLARLSYQGLSEGWSPSLVAGGPVGFLGKAGPLLLPNPPPPRQPTPKDKGNSRCEKALNAAHPV